MLLCDEVALLHFFKDVPAFVQGLLAPANP